MSIFEQIVNINVSEDNLRQTPDLIKDHMLISIETKEIEYVQNDFSDKMVLLGNNKKETITDNNFNMEFSKKTYDLLTYINWSNVVVAGGSIVNIVTNSSSKLNDIDLFVYGLDKSNAVDKIDHLISAIKQKATDLNYETRIYMNDHVINVYVFDTKKLLQVQIILRLYNTLPQIMVGFDVDCCCICWNGKNILTTPRGLHALKYRVNLASLNRRSPSYENRLIKYSTRGFDVITNFDFKKIYNKLFFMNSNNYGFTRLLEQELINNGQLRNIIFSNTLRLRKVSTYTSNYSNYVKYNLDIKNLTDTENCITKYNANMEDPDMKFKKYSPKEIHFLEINVTEQFTGSFNPITNNSWINTNADCDEPVDELGRTKLYLDLKYNNYESISDYENLKLTDMSNFDVKCLAVMYLSNENDIVKIIENKNIQTVNNMYRISPVQLAILLGRTSLALRLMKSHSYESMKELIYMTDNDKLYTTYCNSAGIPYSNVDPNLVAKYECENISNNIHNQNKEDNFVEDFHKLDEFTMCMEVGSNYNSIDKFNGVNQEKLPFEVFRLIFNKNTAYSSGYFSQPSLANKIIKKFKSEELEKYREIMANPNEKRILDYVIYTFEQNESKKSTELSQNIVKLFKLKGFDIDNYEYAKFPHELSKINNGLYTCMYNIYDPRLSISFINKLVDPKDFDKLFNFVLFIDDISLVQKLIPKDDLYVKLKYYYRISSNSGSNIGNFLDQIDKERQLDKIKINKILKNSESHINAITDGELAENYIRCENVFGMTPDDNIVAKMLLIFNKVINKKDKLNDKDLTTLKTMRKSIGNIKRNNEFSKVKSKYFYSQDLHNLFFNKDNLNSETTVSGKSIESVESAESDELVESIELVEAVELVKSTKLTKTSKSSKLVGQFNNFENTSSLYNVPTYIENELKSEEPEKVSCGFAKKSVIRKKASQSVQTSISLSSDSEDLTEPESDPEPAPIKKKSISKKIYGEKTYKTEPVKKSSKKTSKCVATDSDESD